MTIILTKPVRVGGVELAAATTQTFAADVEADLVSRASAAYTINPTIGQGGVPVMADINNLTGGIDLIGPNGSIVDPALLIGPSELFTSAYVGGSIIYVSAAASNGYVVGSDSNNGYSKNTPKLTVNGAISIAKAGDTIILNDGTYTEANFRLLTACAVLPETDYGATLISTNSSVVDIGNCPVSLGKIVIDTNNNGTTICLQGFGAGENTLLTLDGTRFRAHHTNAISFNSAIVVKGGTHVVHTGSGKSIFKLAPNSAYLLKLIGVENLAAPLQVAATAAGSSLVITGSKIRFTDSVGATNYAAYISGVANIVIQDGNEFGVDGNLGPAGINIEPVANYYVASVVIKNNIIEHRGYSSATQVNGGYGIKVGSESLIANNIGLIEITGNKLHSVNHGVFLGYGVTQRCTVRGNVVIDGAIPYISKGNMSGSLFYSNAAFGGAWTGAALRSKASNPVFKNNLCVANGLLHATLGKFQLADTNSVGAAFQNNILYAPSINIPVASSVETGSTASFSNNNYHAGSYTAGAFINGGSTYNTVAAWSAVESSPTSVDPAYTLGNWALPAGSALLSSGLPAAVDFFGAGRAGNSLGPF